MSTTIKVKGSPNPLDAFTVKVMDGYEATQPTGNTTHVVPGRKNPVVFFHATKGRRGTFSFVVGTTDAEVATFNALITRKTTFTLTSTDRTTVNMDFVVDDAGHTIKLDDETRDAFVATVPYLEQ